MVRSLSNSLFEVSRRTHDVDEHLPGRGRGRGRGREVESLVQAAEPDPAIAELADGVDQVRPCCHTTVSPVRRGNRFVELRSARQRAAGAVGPCLHEAGRGQCVQLERRMLVLGGDAGVAGQMRLDRSVGKRAGSGFRHDGF